MEDRADLIYFEPQNAALCGVHALNTLLQGPYFSELDLSQIALELDALEQKLMMESGMESADYMKFLAEESGNVADHGMFSIQVLAKALEVWGLGAIPINNPEASEAKAAPHQERAFICNLKEHWFTIREVYGQWWNFNSVFPAPEPLSQFYLSAFLGTLQEQGYSIFVVRGPLPSPPQAGGDPQDGPGRWLTPSEAREMNEKAAKMKQQGFLQAAYKGVLGKASALGSLMRLQGKGTSGAAEGGEYEGGDDPDLARALAASLADRDAFDGAGPSSLGGGPMLGVGDADLAAAIAASLAEHAQQVPAPQPMQSAGGEAAAAARPAISGADLAAALQASMPQAEPPQGQQAQQAAPSDGVTPGGEPPALPQLGPEPEPGQEGVVEVGLRLPDGARHTHRLLASQHTVGHVAALAASHGVDMSCHRLATQFPRRVLQDFAQLLQDAGIGNKEMLNVEQS